MQTQGTEGLGVAWKLEQQGMFDRCDRVGLIWFVATVLACGYG